MTLYIQFGLVYKLYNYRHNTHTCIVCRLVPHCIESNDIVKLCKTTFEFLHGENIVFTLIKGLCLEGLHNDQHQCPIICMSVLGAYRETEMKKCEKSMKVNVLCTCVCMYGDVASILTILLLH